MMTYYTVMPSPIGEIMLSADGEGLTGLYMEFRRYEPPAQTDWVRADDNAILVQAHAQLDEYFGGKRTDFDLPLNPSGTAFQKQVWQELCNIPYGTTISYGELAARVGNPAASRAVGLANGRNPISIIVPCHRVIGADGSLTGYGGGLERKETLLAHESGLLKPWVIEEAV